MGRAAGTGEAAEERTASLGGGQVMLGCIVFQKYKKGFGVRIPYDSPTYSGKPAQF